MKYIKGFTYGWGYRKGDWNLDEALTSIDKMVKYTACDTVILPIIALQEHTNSTEIYYTSSQHPDIPTIEEVERILIYCKKLDLRIILKCVVNCLDGYWRANINFFPNDIVCEPTWKDWFNSYGKYVAYVAGLAAQYHVDMLIVGCEMVCSDVREMEWRSLIQDVRSIYHGCITYNCDKYQEDYVSWWDACDYISSSGYYPVGSWNKELARIKEVVDKFQLPFFFAEAGCPSRSGSQYIPNDWSLSGTVSEDAQVAYYEEMFSACEEAGFVHGFGLWDWKVHLYPRKNHALDDDYAVYGKKAETVIHDFYKKK